MHQPMEPLYVGIDLEAVVAEMDAGERRSTSGRPPRDRVVRRSAAVSSRLAGVGRGSVSPRLPDAPIRLAR